MAPRQWQVMIKWARGIKFSGTYPKLIQRLPNIPYAGAEEWEWNDIALVLHRSPHHLAKESNPNAGTAIKIPFNVISLGNYTPSSFRSWSFSVPVIWELVDVVQRSSMVMDRRSMRRKCSNTERINDELSDKIHKWDGVLGRECDSEGSYSNYCRLCHIRIVKSFSMDAEAMISFVGCVCK